MGGFILLMSLMAWLFGVSGAKCAIVALVGLVIAIVEAS